MKFVIIYSFHLDTGGSVVVFSELDEPVSLVTLRATANKNFSGNLLRYVEVSAMWGSPPVYVAKYPMGEFTYRRGLEIMYLLFCDSCGRYRTQEEVHTPQNCESNTASDTIRYIHIQ